MYQNRHSCGQLAVLRGKHPLIKNKGLQKGGVMVQYDIMNIE